MMTRMSINDCRNGQRTRPGHTKSRSPVSFSFLPRGNDMINQTLPCSYNGKVRIVINNGNNSIDTSSKDNKKTSDNFSDVPLLGQ